jgi:hypothetical protein
MDDLDKRKGAGRIPVMDVAGAVSDDLDISRSEPRFQSNTIEFRYSSLWICDDSTDVFSIRQREEP